MCIYCGFMLLLLMHALDEVITSVLFPDYFSTINPFMFLRDLFGGMVILGLAIAVYRRFILKVPRLKTNAMDGYAIIIVAIIIFSGIPFLVPTNKKSVFGFIFLISCATANKGPTEPPVPPPLKIILIMALL